MQKKREEKGITLIALVITIIVLLILAGVTIATLTGDNGLLQKVSSAKQENEEAKELELIKLAISAAQAQGEGIITKDNLLRELKQNLNDDTITVRELSSGGWKYNQYKIDEGGKVEEYKSILPNQFQEVEYIESTGAQWINTYFRPKSNEKYKYQLDFKLIDLEKEIQSVMGNDTNDIRVDKNGFWNGNEEWPYIGTNRNNLAIENIPNNGKWIKKRFVNEEIAYQFESGYWYDDYIAIFTNLAYKTQRISKAKVFSAKIWNKDILIRDFIPCYSTVSVTDVNGITKGANTKGLYDTVQGKFYTNQGSGEDFNAGPKL